MRPRTRIKSAENLSTFGEFYLLCIQPRQPLLLVLFFEDYKRSAVLIEGNTLWTGLQRHSSHLCRCVQGRICHCFADYFGFCGCIDGKCQNTPSAGGTQTSVVSGTHGQFCKRGLGGGLGWIATVAVREMSPRSAEITPITSAHVLFD